VLDHIRRQAELDRFTALQTANRKHEQRAQQPEDHGDLDEEGPRCGQWSGRTS
jgi:hypothetical protein